MDDERWNDDVKRKRKRKPRRKRKRTTMTMTIGRCRWGVGEMLVECWGNTSPPVSPLYKGIPGVLVKCWGFLKVISDFKSEEWRVMSRALYLWYSYFASAPFLHCFYGILTLLLWHLNNRHFKICPNWSVITLPIGINATKIPSFLREGINQISQVRNLTWCTCDRS